MSDGEDDDGDVEAQEYDVDEEESSLAGTPANGTDDETELGLPDVEKIDGSVLAVSGRDCSCPVPILIIPPACS